MKTKFTFVGSLFFLLSLTILLTIYLAWLLYPQEISWLNLTNRVHLQPQTIQKGFLPLYRRALLIILSLPLVLGLVGVFIGFEQFFTLFHQILFVGDDTWLFDPAKDPVILILPENFFLHAFLLFFCLYELIFGFMYLQSRKTNR